MAGAKNLPTASMIFLALLGATATAVPALAQGDREGLALPLLPPVSSAAPPESGAAAEPVGDDAPASETQAGGDASECPDLPQHQQLRQELQQIVAPGQPEVNGGLGNHMWAAVVDRGGVVCAVARSSDDPSEQWPGSRAIALAKAFTANGFSLPGFALSTGNLYWPAQPGGSLFAIEAANAVDPGILYEGDARNWGTADDPAVGARVGGSIIFGGGLALYGDEGSPVGGLGLSGDESCTDHVIAWKLRDALGLDHVPDGVTPEDNDNLIHDIVVEPGTKQKISRSGYGHPTCSPEATRIVDELATTHPAGAEGE
jgi:uncharacterized protein GlcG (DUF336 family)